MPRSIPRFAHKSAFALTTPITEKKITGKHVYSIDSTALLICPDTGFKGNDQLRTHAPEMMASHDVAEFRTVMGEDVDGR